MSPAFRPCSAPSPTGNSVPPQAGWTPEGRVHIDNGHALPHEDRRRAHRIGTTAALRAGQPPLWKDGREACQVSSLQPEDAPTSRIPCTTGSSERSSRQWVPVDIGLWRRCRAGGGRAGSRWTRSRPPQRAYVQARRSHAVQLNTGGGGERW